jgi:hypothetical protein
MVLLVIAERTPDTHVGAVGMSVTPRASGKQGTMAIATPRAGLTSSEAEAR